MIVNSGNIVLFKALSTQCILKAQTMRALERAFSAP